MGKKNTAATRRHIFILEGLRERDASGAAL
jgi:hypothetical protein